MYFCHDLKLAYIRVPKTGSTSFVAAFGDSMERNGTDHETMRQALGRVADWDRYVNYKRIGFVRHPEAWVRSMNLVCESRGHWDEYASGGYIDKCPLSEFVRRLRVTPFDWFTAPGGGLLVDTIHRTEDMEAVCKSYGLEAVHVNRSNNLPADEFTAEDRAVIAQKFSRELAFYEGWQGAIPQATSNQQGISP